MCGILGSWHPQGRHPHGLDAALDRLAHRGRDGSGWWHGSACALGHRRLSIVDPAGGAQPLADERGELWMVHNGEIYNHRAVLAGLSGEHRPRTRSDGEAWLHAAEEHGATAAIERLHGMFALAGSDGRTLSLGRDPLGIKPLYWSRHGGGVVFASEIKALLPLVPAESIAEFPPGSWFHGDGPAHRFWRVPDGWRPGDPERDQEAWVDALVDVLDAAVAERLMADVPVGVLLSGGLDSSLIAALMRRRMDVLHSFSVGLAGSPDLMRAREVAAHLDTVHHEVVIGEADIAAALPEVIWHLESWDADLVRSAVPCWFVAQAAARTVKVALTGEGADELFAGYPYYDDYPGGHLHQELRRSVGALHSCNLQRVDRMSMAHALEARVPFLDTAVVELAMAMPPALKLARGQRKYVLRRAAARLLPAAVAWREKTQFDHGSGVAAALRWHFGSPADEEAHYRRLFDERFPAAIGRLVAHWRSGRLPRLDGTCRDV